MLRSASILCLSAVFLAVAPPSFAQRGTEVVDVGDLDTYSERGADAAIRRVEDAAADVCGVQPGAQPVPQRVETRDCAFETTENAIDNSNNSGIIARYRGYDPQIVISEGDADYPDKSKL